MGHLFDFKMFVEERRNNSEKREIIENYEENVESLQEIEDIRDTLFYKEYLSQYDLPKDLNFVLSVPAEIHNDFDWDLLLRLVLASFSSSYNLYLTDQWKQTPVNEIEIILQITVDNGVTKVTQQLDELWCFQVFRLFDIYIEEQMNLAVLKKEGEDEELDAISCERQAYLKKFNQKIDAIEKQIKIILDDYNLNLWLDDFI